MTDKFKASGTISKVTVGMSGFTFTLDDLRSDNQATDLMRLLGEHVNIEWDLGKYKEVDIKLDDCKG
jgi:hypothetical protein